MSERDRVDNHVVIVMVGPLKLLLLFDARFAGLVSLARRGPMSLSSL